MVQWFLDTCFYFYELNLKTKIGGTNIRLPTFFCKFCQVRKLEKRFTIHVCNNSMKKDILISKLKSEYNFRMKNGLSNRIRVANIYQTHI